MSKLKLGFASAVAAALLVGMASQTASASEARPVFKAGYDFGGDTLVRVTFTNGQTDSIAANEGFYLGGGVSIMNDERTVETELTAAWKYAAIHATNGDVSFTRFPIEALLFWHEERFRVGGGLTYHMSPKLDGSGFASPINYQFKDSAGFVVQADYKATENIRFGIRYTALKYGVAGSSSIDASGVGITFTGRF